MLNRIRSRYPFLLHYRDCSLEKNQLRELEISCWARGAVLGKVYFKPSASGASPLFDIYCTARPNHRTGFDGAQSKLVLFGIKPESVRRKAYALTVARLERDRSVTTEQPPFTGLALSATKPESGREETSTAIVDQLVDQLVQDKSVTTVQSPFSHQQQRWPQPHALPAMPDLVWTQTIVPDAAPDATRKANHLLRTFLSSGNGRIAGIAKAFKEALGSGQLAALPLSSSEAIPRIFASEECWTSKPSDSELFGRAIANIHTGHAYRRPFSLRLLIGPAAYQAYHDVVKYLYKPSRHHTPYVLNIPVVCDEVQIHIPKPLLAAGSVSEESTEVAANISPTYALADLQIGETVLPFFLLLQAILVSCIFFTGINHKIITVFGSCVQFWACYPPTKHNLKHFNSRSNRSTRFAALYSVLKTGYFTTATKGQSLYLPAGWLHASYTLAGGLSAGIAWA